MFYYTLITKNLDSVKFLEVNQEFKPNDAHYAQDYLSKFNKN